MKSFSETFLSQTLLFFEEFILSGTRRFFAALRMTGKVKEIAKHYTGARTMT
jgi:hypothetical protein